MLDEKRLILELKQGSKKALHRIYMEYKDNLLTIAASMLHDTHAAEDVLHDVFVSFAGSVGNIQLRGSLKSYLTACIINRVRDMYRKKKHHLVELEDAGQLATDSAGPVRSAEYDENTGRLTDALAQLSDRPAKELTEGLLLAVEDFAAGRPADDDRTLVTLKAAGP